MRTALGRITELQLEPNGSAGAWISCPPQVVPAPGQYTLAWAEDDAAAPLTTPVFSGAFRDDGFYAVGPLPPTWQPGTSLLLRGPLGHGFDRPASTRRVALAALGSTAGRLLALVGPALESGAAVALFAGCPLPPLPSDLEVAPLSSLPDALAWADWLALDLPAASLPALRPVLSLAPNMSPPCPARLLLLTEMPCGALAECGACAVPARRGWKLACKDGPVFDLRDLEW